MDFSDALRAMKAGKRVRRGAWRDPIDIGHLARFGIEAGSLLSDDWLIEDQNVAASLRPINDIQQAKLKAATEAYEKVFPRQSALNKYAQCDLNHKEQLENVWNQTQSGNSQPSPRKPKIGDVVVCHRKGTAQCSGIVTGVSALGAVFVATIGGGLSETLMLPEFGDYRWSWPE